MEELPTRPRLTEELPSDITAVEEEYVRVLLDAQRILDSLASQKVLSEDKVSEASPTLDMLGAVRDSLVDIKNVLELQNQRLEKLDSMPALENRLKEAENHSEDMALTISRLEGALNNFRAKTTEIDYATSAFRETETELKELMPRINYLSKVTEQRNEIMLAMAKDISSLAETLEERTKNFGAAAEGIAEADENIRKSSSSLASLQEKLDRIASDVLQKNDDMKLLISEIALSRDMTDISASRLESSSIRLKESVEDIEKRNMTLASAMETLSQLAPLLEEKSAGLGNMVESYGASRAAIEQSAVLLGTLQDNLRDLRNDVFERNQYLSIMLSDIGVSKEMMEKNIQLLETSSIKLKETAEEVDKKTDDILNVTMRKVGDLQNLRDVLYDDIDQVDGRVKKVQKAIDKQKKDAAKISKKQAETLKLIKRMSKKVDKMDRQMRRKKK
ncbi:MAG: hypothetical protein J4469_02540 [Candidatus Aenigmarchaeota archaeon]|nr:hypothetical protein [Candidatus Aenigmarchaeota archaeon]